MKIEFFIENKNIKRIGKDAINPDTIVSFVAKLIPIVGYNIKIETIIIYPIEIPIKIVVYIKLINFNLHL